MSNQPQFLTTLAEENCKFFYSLPGFDIWLTADRELILQQSNRESDYACIPLDLARTINCSRYRVAVAVVDFIEDQQAKPVR